MASDGETSCANDPNFAVIYSFLKVFGKLYGLEVPTITKLQEFVEDTQEVPEPLKELHLRLLRRALRTLHSNRWEKGMIKFCHQQGHHQEAWEIERFSYKKASTQVKLKVLKILLEYQFTCHPKFKGAVNAITCKDLRLDPIGRDRNGCVYWLQVDHEANLCLYKEDQDEETWQLVARTREELVKVIGQLKSGEQVCPLVTTNANEDSSGAENSATKPEVKPEEKPEVEEDNEEEFLSPESESDHEDVETEVKDQPPDNQPKTNTFDNNIHEEQASHNNVEEIETSHNEEENSEAKDETIDKTEEEKDRTIENTEDNSATNIEDSKLEEIEGETLSNVDETAPEKCEQNNGTVNEEICVEEASVNDVNTEQNTKTEVQRIIEDEKQIIEDEKQSIEDEKQSIEDEKQSIEDEKQSIEDEQQSIEEENQSIEEDNRCTEKENQRVEEEKPSVEEEKPSVEEEEHIKNEAKSVETKGNEEVEEAIEEPVMHVTGEGSGADCESFFIGEEITETVMYFSGEGWGYDNDTGNPEVIEENEAHSDEENDNDEPVNGEHELTNTKTNISKGVKLKTVNKRSLKKQSNDGSDMKPDVKKPCVRDIDKSNSSIDNDKRDTSTNDKSITDTESPNKSNVKKSRGKVKKNAIVRKIKINDGKEAINSVSETDNCQDKTSIIEKRKSSVSSVDHEDGTTENDKEKSPEKESKVEDPLPPKKLRLEPTPENDVNATHSKDAVSDSVENDKKKDCVDDPISKRKKIKATKGKFKRKNVKHSKSNNGEKANDINEKKACKSLKRSLVDTTMSDKNKTESQSESEEDEPITSGKRLKIKPKKIITSSRKKVEAKLMDKHSSDESEEETLYSLAGKKTTKKLTKKKTKPKAKEKCNKRENEAGSENESDLAPVRQSRRIAQQKIKEEAERRHQEEIALRELKMIHKKKGKDDDEEEWVGGSAGSSSEDTTRRSKKKVWKECDSTGPEPDSESEVDIDPPHNDPDPDYVNKSDHEFSPESDLESGEPAEPLKRARTLQEEKDEGFCKACGSAEQPEWILLCDACDAGYHASCLKPMLFLVPEGDWFCPPCNHDKLIKCLETELVKYDELLAVVEEERARRKLEEPEPEPEQEPQGKQEDDDEDSESSGSWSGSSGGVYRLRARRQLPVSLRAQEYDRLISAAIKEEYVEPTTSAGNQGRGKDISTIIEAAEEEKMKAEREAQEQGKPIEMKKSKKKQRRKPRKLNSLDVPSEDDDETDEDFKDIGGASSSEDISSSASRDSSNDSRSSDSLPIRRTGRTDKKERPKMTESSPEVKKKKKGLFQESSSESAGAKEWSKSKKSKSSSRDPHKHSKDKKRRRRGHGHHKHGLTQYDAAGNVIRARVTYGGLSGPDSDNDWSPKHRTRQKKINYTEMPNTESEDEMHKSSGKHMPDSSDEFKISSDDDSDSDSDRAKRKKEEESEEKRKALSDLVKKTAVVPLEKLPEDVTKAKTEELQAHLSNLKEAMDSSASNARPSRGKGSRGGRGSRGPRGRGRGVGGAPRNDPPTDDALAKLVGVKIKELGQDGVPVTPGQMEKEKRRQEREAKLAEKEAKRLERAQKREEKEKLKEQKAKEREEKRLARLAMQETKRIKKEKDFGGMGGGEMRINMFVPPDYNNQRPPGPHGPHGPIGPQGPTGPHGPPGQHGPHGPHGPPRLQVRAELRGMMADDRGPLGPHQHNALREGTLSVAGSPQPFRPVSEEPSIITRMPHMLNQHYNRGPMVYGPGGTGAGGPGGGFPPRGVFPPRGQLPPSPGGYYRLPPHYAHNYPPHMQGPGGSASPMQHPGQSPNSMGHGFPYRPGPPGAPQLAPDARSMQPHQSHPPGLAGPQGKPPGAPGTSTILQSLGQSHPSHMQAHNLGPRGPNPPSNLAQLQNMGPGRPSSMGPGGPHPMNPGSHPGMNHGGPHSNIGGPHQIIRDQNPQSLPPGAPQVPSTGLGPSISGAPGAPGPPTSQPSERDMPIKIKAEVKTEPEYRSPPGSPVESAEPARHPKIKVTEGGARRPRFPLGPYAPHLHYPPYPGPAGPPPPAYPDRNKIQYGPQGPHEAPTRPGSPPRGFFPPRGYPPPLLRGPPALNGAPYRPPPAHSPHHPSPAQSPQQFPARSAQSPSHGGPPGPPHSPPCSPTQSPHHPGMPPRPPSTKSPHHLPLHRPPPPRSPHNLYPSQSPHHPGLHRPSPIQSPHHPGLPPAHSPHHSGLPPMQSPHHPGIPPTQSLQHHSGAPPMQSPHHPGAPPTQSPHHPGIPPTQSPHHPGIQPTQSPHHPGIPPTQSPHHLGAPPAQSPHHPGAPPVQSPHQPGAPPVQSPHQPGAPPVQSPHHPGVPPAQSPHHPGAPPAQSPHHPGAPPAQSPHHPGAATAQSPHHPGAPTAQSPHHPGAPPMQSPHHSGVPPAQSPHHSGMPHTQSAHHPGIPPTQAPHHPRIPPTQSPHHPGAPPAQLPHYHGAPQAQSPHHPGVPPAQSPHHAGAPPMQSPQHPGVPPAQPQHHPGPTTQSGHHPGLPLPQSMHHPPPQVSHHPGLPPTQSLHHSGLPLPQTSQHPGLPPARSPHHLHHGMVGHRPALLQPLGSGSPPRNISYPFYGDRRLPQPIPRDSLPPKPNSPRRIDSEHDRIVPKLEMPVSLDRVKVEPNREEGSVFGGLVSYFSSQHEDDIDG